MKICTITCHRVYNYGASLQAYALQNYLEGKGHTVKIIDYRPWYLNMRYNFWFIAPISRMYSVASRFWIIRFIYCLLKRRDALKNYGRKRAFDNFTQQYLRLTDRSYNTLDSLKNMPPLADLYIAGSDQIWNLNCTNGVCGPYFLDFVSGKRKIAYAPSMGDYLLLDNDREKMRKALEEFYAISVREASMIQMLEQLNLPISIQTVVDPTLLLKKEDYIQGLKLEKMVSAGKYIFVYILGGTKAYGNIVNEAKKIAKQNGLQIKYVFDNNNAMIKNIGFDCSGCNPREFVSMIYNAEYVLTNSFHATVFSIIFKKNFTSYARGKSSGRITELLSSLGLEERFNLESNGCIIAINSYDKVYQLLANMKIESMIYLENALNVEGINSNE